MCGEGKGAELHQPPPHKSIIEGIGIRGKGSLEGFLFVLYYLISEIPLPPAVAP